MHPDQEKVDAIIRRLTSGYRPSPHELKIVGSYDAGISPISPKLVASIFGKIANNVPLSDYDVRVLTMHEFYQQLRLLNARDRLREEAEAEMRETREMAEAIWVRATFIADILIMTPIAILLFLTTYDGVVPSQTIQLIFGAAFIALGVASYRKARDFLRPRIAQSIADRRERRKRTDSPPPTSQEW